MQLPCLALSFALTLIKTEPVCAADIMLTLAVRLTGSSQASDARLWAVLYK